MKTVHSLRPLENLPDTFGRGTQGGGRQNVRNAISHLTAGHLPSNGGIKKLHTAGWGQKCHEGNPSAGRTPCAPNRAPRARRMPRPMGRIGPSTTSTPRPPVPDRHLWRTPQVEGPASSGPRWHAVPERPDFGVRRLAAAFVAQASLRTPKENRRSSSGAACESAVSRRPGRNRVALSAPTSCTPWSIGHIGSSTNYTRRPDKQKSGEILAKLSALFRSIGGADGDRTRDLMSARQALSQLSYSPCFSKNAAKKIGTKPVFGK